jgi:DNA-binding PadR family transcriptional regulator
MDRQPLTEATFFILLSLADGPRHGYAIMKSAEALSDTRVRLSTGTLYGAIKRLLEGGWIARAEEAAGENQRDRQAYSLTDTGRAILSAEVRRLESLVKLSRAFVSGEEA